MVKDSGGRTPVCVAVMKGSCDVAQCIFSQGWYQLCFIILLRYFYSGITA